MVTDVSVRTANAGGEDRSWTRGDGWWSRNVPIDWATFTGPNFTDGTVRSGCLIAVGADGKGCPYETGKTPVGYLASSAVIPADKTRPGTAGVFTHLQVVTARLPYKTGAGAPDQAAKAALPLIEHI